MYEAITSRVQTECCWYIDIYLRRRFNLTTYFSPLTLIIEGLALLPFTASRRKELNGLLESGVFEVVDIKDLLKGIGVFNSRFVDEIKNPSTDNDFD